MLPSDKPLALARIRNISECQRLIVLTFGTPTDAQRWDGLSDEQALYELWSRASEARTKRSKS